MDNKEFGFLMESRTKKFAISIIRLSASLPSSSEGRVLKNQVTKSGTSIGANYREANCSRSSADFVNRIKICQSETNETLYWLEIISEIQMIESEKLQSLIIEAKELLAIFTSVIAKLKQNKT
ncbi:MAG: four helix bundle protein [Bacteroidota bacterium]